MRHPNAYALLCVPCHRLFDAKKITFSRATAAPWRGAPLTPQPAMTMALTVGH